nr:MAG TPA: hypothetical protein [Caudoviricetes sp.]
MLTIGKFDLEIEIAKKEVIQKKKEDWIRKWARENPKARTAPEPPLDEITPKAWFISEWDTGFVVVDYEELKKCPKRYREKILALGGI